jgi:RNA polymerase sigma-70 factor (ECF subfamily)
LPDVEHLFKAHRESVFRYLSRVVGRPETARDLTQEVFLRATRAGVPEADEAGRRAWVFSIARNLALNHQRDDHRHGGAPLPLAETAQPATQELGAAIRQAIDALPALDRDVFLLRESAGLSYGEIASACDLSLEAVRARLKRAREALRASLDAPVSRAREGLVSLRGSNRGEES